MNGSLSIDEFLAFTANELLVDVHEITIDMPFRESRTWSSLNALVYVSRINDEMDVLLSSSDLALCITFRDIYQLIASK